MLNCDLFFFFLKVEAGNLKFMDIYRQVLLHSSPAAAADLFNFSFCRRFFKADSKSSLLRNGRTVGLITLTTFSVEVVVVEAPDCSSAYSAS